MKTLPTFLALVLVTYFSFSQTTPPPEDVPELSLEELMNIKISVSKTNLSLRETPAIISVITRKEIRNMGARDLMDVLNQVPGLNFGADVQNTVGAGVRGNWGTEGKILLLIDGLEMNEILFSTTQFGQHYDIKNIDRIEIIRGPGSSIYGGYAELGVINIITQTGDKTKGVSVLSQVGTGEDGLHRMDAGFTIGNGTEDFNYSISGYVGAGIRSPYDYVDVTGDAISFKKNSDLKPMMFNAGINKGNLSARIIYDGYSLETVDQFGLIEPKDKISFNQLLSEVKYKFNVSEKFNITPRLGFKTGTPWGVSETGYIPYEIKATRISPVVNATWDASENFQLVTGFDSYFDKGEYTGEDVDPYFGESNSVDYSNIGVFAQGVYKSSFVNLTVGARMDNHSQFGAAFSPRIGLTKIFNKVHTKLLYSRAFRAPAIENINYNSEIEPEKTGVAELEIGFKPNNNNFITLNFYDITIDDPIVFEGNANTYLNFKEAGSRGFELEYRLNARWGYVTANYAYYTAKDKNKVALYADPTDEARVLGMPNGRVNITGSVNITSSLSINPTMNYIGKRAGITSVDVSDNYVFSEFDSQFFFNLYLRYNKGNFDGGIGVYDLLNEKQYFIQPYASGHAPLPGLGREFIIKVAYTIPFGNKA
jgi:outer membrane cobalamin receptor